MEDNSHLLLVDGNNCYWRAYHGLLHQRFTFQGKSTWGIVGTVNSVSTAIKKYSPTHVLVVFDWGRSEYRVNMWPPYKEGRQGAEYIDFEDANNQLIKSQDLLRLFGLQVWKERGIEADDIIARAVEKYGPDMEHITIVSGDKDLRQLIDTNVTLWSPSLGKKEESTWDLQSVVDFYGVVPARLPEIWALSGDKVDNIPGVKGIGEKTAIKLLAEYGDISKVTISDEKKIKDSLKDIHLSYQLVQLNPSLCSLELEADDIRFAPVEPGDTEAKELVNALDEYGMDQVYTRWKTGSLWKEPWKRLGSK